MYNYEINSAQDYIDRSYYVKNFNNSIISYNFDKINTKHLVEAINRAIIDNKGETITTLTLGCSVNLKYKRILFSQWTIVPTATEYYDGIEEYKKHQNNIQLLKENLRNFPSGIEVKFEERINDGRTNAKANEANYLSSFQASIIVSDAYAKQYCQHINNIIKNHNVVDEKLDTAFIDKAIAFQDKMLQNHLSTLENILETLNPVNFYISKQYVSDNDRHNNVKFDAINMSDLPDDYAVYGFARALAVILNRYDAARKYQLQFFNDQSEIYCVVSYLDFGQELKPIRFHSKYNDWV